MDKSDYIVVAIVVGTVSLVVGGILHFFWKAKKGKLEEEETVINDFLEGIMPSSRTKN